MNARFIPIAAAIGLLLAGCRQNSSPSNTLVVSPPNDAAAANQLFLNQKNFDPWVLKSADSSFSIPLYISNGKASWLVTEPGQIQVGYQAGDYRDGQLEPFPVSGAVALNKRYGQWGYELKLNMKDGKLGNSMPHFMSDAIANPVDYEAKWEHLWQTSDIVITGDPEAQQVTHANLFYLLSSTYPGSDHSIPPFGLSSNLYGGHIFWDAEVWMLPALIVQHPEYAKPIVDYRFKTLGQAKKNAKAHGFGGAEYVWESADTGVEMAPAEFAQERHITADVGWAAWQYYLWTGDRNYLKSEGWPILQATANYWVSRVTKGAEGKYHAKHVLSPDETAGVVDDDAWTNAVVQANLQAAAQAAKVLGLPADPKWAAIADRMYFPYDKARGIPAENSKPLTEHFAAKQADTLLLLHPLHQPYEAATAGKMLDFYTTHTIKNGPAMTASMEAIVAARLRRAQQSLDLFHDSYRPFMRGPWDAFAEKRTSNRVYFCTGMGGCLQSVLYGFAGLQVVPAGEKARGTKIAGDAVASLYADPHLPPGWAGLTVKGVRFRGRTLDVALAPGNRMRVTPR